MTRHGSFPFIISVLLISGRFLTAIAKAYTITSRPNETGGLATIIT